MSFIWNIQKLKMIDVKNNWIYCQDVRDFLQALPEESIDCCVTDCPYKIIASWVSLKKDENGNIIPVSDWTNCSNKWLKKNANEIPSAIKNGTMFKHNDIEFKEWLPLLYKVMKPKSHTYIMINSRNLKSLWEESEKAWFKFQNLLVWSKGNATPNKYYMQTAEFILLLTKKGSRSINNMGTKNILEVKNIIWKKKHPTEKPSELYEIMISNSTNPGDTVIDPFAWCWPIIESCKKLWRVYIANDSDETYIKLCEERSKK